MEHEKAYIYINISIYSYITMTFNVILSFIFYAKEVYIALDNLTNSKKKNKPSKH